MSLDNLRFEQEHGSGLQLHLGYGLTEWERDRAVAEMVVRDHHLNRAGLIHGGVLTTLLDSVSGCAGCWCPEPGRIRRALTLSLTTNYMAAAKRGVLRAEGRRVGGGRKVFFTAAEVVDDRGTVLATATGTFRYHRGSEDEHGEPR
jgi:uncharacterized protein (TIGR00369 family)